MVSIKIESKLLWAIMTEPNSICEQAHNLSDLTTIQNQLASLTMKTMFWRDNIEKSKTISIELSRQCHTENFLFWRQ